MRDTQTLFVIDLKIYHNWMSCILSGNLRKRHKKVADSKKIKIIISKIKILERKVKEINLVNPERRTW